ncbi:MAG: hypothetical protein ABI682_00775 [Acidobacteriota bacterium]
MWRSNNGGLNWLLIGSAVGVPSLGLPPARRFRSSPYNLGVSPTDLNRIAVGAAGGFLDITTDGGATWTDVDLIASAPGYQGFTTNVTWQDNQNLWITSVAQATGAVRVIKASIANPTASWSTATFVAKQNGLPDLPVTRVYIDPRDSTHNTLYAATHVGIYSTTDGGANWAPFGNGLPTVRVNDIYMPPDGGFIRLATYGRGIWELSQIELGSVTLSDDVASCDLDGVLDNGETGRLKVTLVNQGPNNVNQGTLTVTSSNPNVTFPQGNVIQFPPLQKKGHSTGFVPVTLNGALGMEQTTFKIAFQAPELGLPSPFNLDSTFRLNYNEQLQSSATESFESASPVWTASGDPSEDPNITRWQRRALSPVQHVFWGPNNNGQRDDVKGDLPDQQSLTSPTMRVGSTSLGISFKHRFSFEAGGWDGGVVEISVNGGAWTAVGTSPAFYNGSTNAVTSAPIGASRPAFVNRIAGWPNFSTATLDLGTAYNGQDVRIRFRIGADESTGAPGWDIDDITITGITGTPFTSLVPQIGVCTP